MSEEYFPDKTLTKELGIFHENCTEAIDRCCSDWEKDYTNFFLEQKTRASIFMDEHWIREERIEEILTITALPDNWLAVEFDAINNHYFEIDASENFQMTLQRVLMMIPVLMGLDNQIFMAEIDDETEIDENSLKMAKTMVNRNNIRGVKSSLPIFRQESTQARRFREI